MALSPSQLAALARSRARTGSRTYSAPRIVQPVTPIKSQTGEDLSSVQEYDPEEAARERELAKQRRAASTTSPVPRTPYTR